MSQTTENWEAFLIIVTVLVIIGYYADLIGSVLSRQITKHRFYLGIIPFLFWVLIFLEQFEQLEK